MRGEGLTVLGGGTGTPMLLDGIMGTGAVDPSALRVVVNTADDVYVAGGRVCPDVDTVLYTLADLADRDRWYGIHGDTTATHEQLRKLADGTSPPETPTRTRGLPHYPGDDPFMRIGDRDRAVHLFRAALLRRGHDLTEVTRVLCDRFDVTAGVLPMTNDPVGSYVSTERRGTMHLQEYLVRHDGQLRVTGVEHRGLKRANPSDPVMKALEDPVLIGPSNPVTSVAPILDLPGVAERLGSTRVVAISPFLEDEAFSGPAGTFMEAEGFEASSRGTARYYGECLDEIILDHRDKTEPPVSAPRADIVMDDGEDRRRVARRALDRLFAEPASEGGPRP